jgi:magnesium chelatase family protein
MFSKVCSASMYAINASIISVEVDISYGLISWHIVGLPDTAVKESKQRITSAIKNCGIKLPDRKITINLSPADLKKEGSLYDLPITLALLDAAEIIKLPLWLKQEALIIGEISLDGIILGSKESLAIAADMKKLGKKYIVVPYDRAEDVSIIEDIIIIAPKTLSELVDAINRENIQFYEKKETLESKKINFDKDEKIVDMLDVVGNNVAKRALQIAAAGYHSALLIGSPGSGKTMLAERMKTLLPLLTKEEQIELTKIYALSHTVNDLTEKKGLITQRPFIAPHHTISQGGLVGGGTIPRPGAITLAHRGVLFLDELLEFKRHVLEVLRQPLESKNITVSRAHGEYKFPADFLLIAATNPCPCGHYGDQRKLCVCSSNAIKNYVKKLSGPFLDRIDMHVPVYSLSKFYDDTRVMSSKELYEGVLIARERQLKRYKKKNIFNGTLSSYELKKYTFLKEEAKKTLENIYEKDHLTMRGCNKIIAMALTIADIQNKDCIEIKDLLEAASFRIVDKIIH